MDGDQAALQEFASQLDRSLDDQCTGLEWESVLSFVYDIFGRVVLNLDRHKLAQWSSYCKGNPE